MRRSRASAPGSGLRGACLPGDDISETGRPPRRIGLADALSLLVVIRDGKPVLCEKSALRWFAKRAAEHHYLLLGDARELVDLLDSLAGRPGRRRSCSPASAVRGTNS